jgi:hypothetical protein
VPGYLINGFGELLLPKETMTILTSNTVREFVKSGFQHADHTGKAWLVIDVHLLKFRPTRSGSFRVLSIGNRKVNMVKILAPCP